MVVARVERADVHGRRDERPGTGTDGDGSTAPANTRVSLAARDSRWWSLRPGVGQGDRGTRRYRVRLGFAKVHARRWRAAMTGSRASTASAIDTMTRASSSTPST